MSSTSLKIQQAVRLWYASVRLFDSVCKALPTVLEGRMMLVKYRGKSVCHSLLVLLASRMEALVPVTGESLAVTQPTLKPVRLD